MNNLVYIKLFEDYDEESLSEKDAIFTISEEEIEDLLLVVSDEDFKIKVKELFVDANDFSEIVSKRYWYSAKENDDLKAEFRKKMLNSQIRGAYKIDIIRESEDDEIKECKYGIQDLKIFNLLISEINQLSKRVEHLEWQPYGIKTAGISSHDVMDENVWIRLFIVCPPNKNTSIAKKLAKKEYQSKLSDCIGNKIWNLKERVQYEFTSTLKQSLKTYNYNKEDGKIFFFFKQVSKSVINLNTKKLERFKHKLISVDDFKIENSKLAKEMFEKSPKFLDDVYNIIEIKYDPKKIVTNCKLEIKTNF